MTKGLKHFALGVALALSGLGSPCFAGEWQKPWPSVQGASAKKCAEIFDAFQLQAVCMDKREEWLQQMQGNFWQCQKKWRRKRRIGARKYLILFSLQAVCMENEKKGYDKMKQY